MASSFQTLLRVSSPIYILLELSKITTEGVVRSFIPFGIIIILPSLEAPTQLKVVPKSIPKAYLLILINYL